MRKLTALLATFLLAVLAGCSGVSGPDGVEKDLKEILEKSGATQVGWVWVQKKKVDALVKKGDTWERWYKTQGKVTQQTVERSVHGTAAHPPLTVDKLALSQVSANLKEYASSCADGRYYAMVRSTIGGAIWREVGCQPPVGPEAKKVYINGKEAPPSETITPDVFTTALQEGRAVLGPKVQIKMGRGVGREPYLTVGLPENLKDVNGECGVGIVRDFGPRDKAHLYGYDCSVPRDLRDGEVLDLTVIAPEKVGAAAGKAAEKVGGFDKVQSLKIGKVNGKLAVTVLGQGIQTAAEPID